MGISVQNLTKIYGTQKAIDDVSFDIEPGEIVGFLGPNGAGKTTTMKIITCFLSPDSGRVEIRSKIGYLPENNPLYLDMYVHEFLRYMGRLNKIPKKDLQKRVDDVVEMTGLTREQHKKIGALSKGYRQRVGLSQALIHDPEILILDEPTTGLDPNQIVEIRNLIRDISKEKTIIFSTHILPEVEAIADRVIIINQGTLVADKQLKELQEDSNQMVLRVAFEKPDFDFRPLLVGQEGIEIASSSSREFVVSSPQGLDLRPQIMQASLAAGNPIDLLQKDQRTLEEIFRSLTDQK
ncbi:UNVERIFIED_CONTAM: hypothetical protein GTU68_051191 [Idotea baltica]|nr:hypothetical protein [Idotea baltica]